MLEYGFSLTRIFPYKNRVVDSPRIRENKGQTKPVFQHFIRHVCFNQVFIILAFLANWNYGKFDIFRKYSEVFCKKSVLRNFAKFTGKHLRQSLFFDKVAGLRPVTLLKKRLWHSCFPVNFAKFLRTPFFIEHLWYRLLNIIILSKRILKGGVLQELDKILKKLLVVQEYQSF